MENKINIHDRVKVNYRNHPMYGLKGKVVGIRGEIEEGNYWLLVYFPSHQRSFLVPSKYTEKE